MLFRPSSATLGIAALVAILGATAAPLAAQATGTVRGRITEAATQRPVSDAQVAVVDSRVGAITGAAGEFVLQNIPAGQRVIRVRRVGYAVVERTVTVAANAETRLDIALESAATQLDQVVVTGTAGATTVRTLGNSVTALNVSDLTDKSSLQSVTDVLQSKSPGVTLIPGSGVPGTAADIRIRGTSSLSASNRPIFYIDGIRYSDASNGGFGPSGAGDGTFAQGTSALDAINPADIESVEIIKGPAAATLYGADAAGGVIQIITKKGVQGAQKVRWNAKVEGGGTNWALPMRTNYTTCTAARQADVANWPGCDPALGIQPGQVITGNPLRDDPNALRTGTYQNYTLSARGGGERYSFYVAGDMSGDEGVFFNSFSDRKGARANATFTISDQLDVALNTSYNQTHTRLPLGDDAGGGIIISATRGQPGSAANQGRGWRINVPEVSNEYDNQLTAERTVLGGTVNYRPVSWFRNRFTAGVDFNSPVATIYYAPYSRFSAGDFPSGYIAQRMPQTHLYTFDYAGTITNQLPRDFSSEFSVGAQGTKNQRRTVSATGTGLPSPDLKLVGNATTVTGSTAFSEQASLGFFVQEQVGYANRLFVTGALRMDNNSAFGSALHRVFYPKASLSYVISEEPSLARVFQSIRADNLKLRFAYGQAGRAPGPYDAVRTYTSTRVVLGNGTIASGLVPSAPGNENLSAERGTEYEGGFDASFLGDRLGIEFTGYSKKTTDALLSIPNAPSLGFTASRYINFGQISNSGIELALRGTPVRTRNFAWEAQFTYATNHNKLDRLNFAGITQLIPYNPYAPTAYPTQLIREGYPIAGFWGADVKRKADGSYDLTSGGALQFDTLKYVGSATPTHEGSFASTFTFFRDFRVYALIDFKGGNYILNQKDRNRDQTTNRNSLRFNDPSHPLSSLDSAYYSGNATAPWIQPADFVKLRDVSVSYSLPRSVSRMLRAEAATFTVAGHNLGFISKKYPGIDPEVNFFGQGTFYTGTSNFVQFIRTDSYTLPMLRRFTASLNVNF